VKTSKRLRLGCKKGVFRFFLPHQWRKRWPPFAKGVIRLCFPEDGLFYAELDKLVTH
jgi:hypothetical protein